MTRRRDLMCEDIFGCDHEPETPVVEDREIVHWLCRCGRKHNPEKKSDAQEEGKS